MRFFLKLLIVLAFVFNNADVLFANKPRLVIGIMIDGLQQSHLEQIRTRLGQEGLRKLTGDGVVFENVVCNMLSAGNASDISTMLTGTTPAYHGITADYCLNRSTGRITSVFEDKNQTGIETNLKLSAINMKTTHLVDEVMMTFPEKSKSYVVALNAEDALAMGGHAATGVVWVNDVTMNWCTSTYYTAGLPWQALDMNSNNSFGRYAIIPWLPLYQPNTYLVAESGKSPKSFQFLPAEKRIGSNSSLLKNTPAVNSLVSELGIRLIMEQNLGKDNNPDLLLLQFTVKTPYEKAFSIQTLQKEDIYLRLDAELQFLMKKIESVTGTDEVLYFVYGNQSNSRSPDELKEFHLNAGYFNASRSLALLNSYLIALYGQEKWVDGYYNKQIYLNHTKIEEKKLNLTEFQQVVANFMMEFEGIQLAFTSKSMMNMPDNQTGIASRVRNSIYKTMAGDVILTLIPGWIETDDNERVVGESSDLISTIPVYFYGSGIASQIISQQVKITDICPTLCHIIAVPFTNANTGNVINIQFNQEK